MAALGAHREVLIVGRLNPMHGRQDHHLPDPRVGRRGQEVIEESCAAGKGIDHRPQAEFAVVADIVGCLVAFNHLGECVDADRFH